jgi:cytochrome c oxidase subunit 2
MKNLIIFISFFICLLFNNIFYEDISESNQLSFQESASSCGNNLIFFHDDIMFYIVIILVLVGWLLFSVINNKNYNKFLLENNFIEIV